VFMAFIASLHEYATSSMLPNLVKSCIELIATIKPSPPTPTWLPQACHFPSFHPLYPQP